jgi:hypothetical protein
MKKTNQPSTPSEARINANRQNAQKATGPRTAEGKAASSRGTLWVRLLHGLRANKHILLDEDPEDFLILLHDLFDRFRPVGDGEEMLVTRIAADQWRLDRSLTMEAGIYRERLDSVAAEDQIRQRSYAQHKKNHESRPETVPPPPPLPDPGDRLARAFTVDCERPNSLAKLARYETSIGRSIDRCLRQLKIYQAARNASTLNPGPGAPSQEGPAVPPAEAAANPSKSENYHSNPKNGGIAQASAAMVLVMLALLHALPALVAALSSLLTGPRTGHNHPKMNIFHRLAAAAHQIRQALPTPGPTARNDSQPLYHPADGGRALAGFSLTNARSPEAGSPRLRVSPSPRHRAKHPCDISVPMALSMYRHAAVDTPSCVRPCVRSGHRPTARPRLRAAHQSL